MLSVYKLLKPPVFGNIEYKGEVGRILNFDDFKCIFSEDSDNKQVHLEKIRRKLDEVLDKDDVNSEEAAILLDDENDKNTETKNCIIYYLTGFICKKMYKCSTCSVCKKGLFHKSPDMNCETTAHQLTTLKSRGGLNHPNMNMFGLFQEIEHILMKHISSVDVFDETIDEFFVRKKNFSFVCNTHKEDILSEGMFLYISMRVKQFYKQNENRKTKMSAVRRKEAKLQKF